MCAIGCGVCVCLGGWGLGVCHGFNLGWVDMA